MQEPTHILTGVLIQRSLQPMRPHWLRLGLTAVCAFLSHGLLDRLANATYHPPSAKLHDSFWIIFHSGVLILTLYFLVLFWSRYKWGIFFACLPDLDWVFIHGQEILHIHSSFYRTPVMHNLLHKVFDDMWPFSHLRVPNHRQNPWACLWEVALVLLMLAAIYYPTWRKRNLSSRPV